VTLSVPHAYEVSRELLRRNIIVDFRKGAGIRLAPHFYNSDEEAVYAVDQIGEIVGKKAYRKHSVRRAGVT
jgi:kynureninase